MPVEKHIPKIKICGITKVEEIKILKEFNVDIAGFVMFYEKSKRNNSIQNIKKLLLRLNKSILKVAVVVSPTIEQLKIIEDLGFDVIQVHGILENTIIEQSKIAIWRAYNICKNEEISLFQSEYKIVGYVLDSENAGSGKTFDWENNKEINIGDKLLILAGGLNENNVLDGINIFKPDIVDVSSGVEGIDGKDYDKIKNFVRKVRYYE